MRARRWCLATSVAAWLCAGSASAQTEPIEVVCERGCREVRVRGERAPSFRVRVLPGALEVVTPGVGGGPAQRVRLSSADGVDWRVVVAPPARPPLTPFALRRRVMVVLGTVFLSLGATAGLVSYVPYASLQRAAGAFNESCWLRQGRADPGVCTTLYEDVLQHHRGMVAGLVVGGALAAGGVALLVVRAALRAPAPVAHAWVAPALDGAVLGVSGTF
ncbi:MAG: hypothetical protein U0324_19045 [Polyangiales bacterium]